MYLPDWLPGADAEGHPYADGVNLVWVSCPGCPAARAGGHHVYYCRINGCRALPAFPPGHVGQRPSQR